MGKPKPSVSKTSKGTRKNSSNRIGGVPYKTMTPAQRRMPLMRTPILSITQVESLVEQARRDRAIEQQNLRLGGGE